MVGGGCAEQVMPAAAGRADGGSSGAAEEGNKTARQCSRRHRLRRRQGHHLYEVTGCLIPVARKQLLLCVAQPLQQCGLGTLWRQSGAAMAAGSGSGVDQACQRLQLHSICAACPNFEGYRRDRFRTCRYSSAQACGAHCSSTHSVYRFPRSAQLPAPPRQNPPPAPDPAQPATACT